MEAFLRDVRQALRGLRSERGFTAVAVLTLALGVGANTAIFSVVNGVLLQPLDFPEPHELLAVGTSFTDGRQTSGNLSINKLMAVREMSSVQSAGGTFPWDVTLMDAEERPVNAALFLATSGFFEAFGFPMAAGRPFVEEHYVNGGAIILGYALWQSFYGGDPGIIGNTVTTSNGPVTVVGVAPAGFDHPGGAEGWIAFNPGPTGAAHFLESVVRLRDGVSLEQARAEFPVTQQRLFEQFPQSNESRAFTVDPLMDFYVGEVRSSLLILMGAAVTLLIIACANVMSLLLSRGTVMGREVAVRIALGASRGQILRQLLTSSAVLAAAGAVLGLGLGLGLLNLVLGLAPADLPRMDAVGLDSAVVGYTVGLIFFSALLFGTLPAIRLLGTDVRSVMGEQARGSSAGPGRGRAFRGLIATQVALAVVLVIGAGLLTRSFQALNSVDPGFEAQDRSIFTLRWDVQNYPWFRDLTRLDRELREALLEVPGVTTVASTSDIPLDALLSGIYGHRAEGGLLTDDDNAHQARLRVISPGYFETLGIPLAAGRPFNELDEFDNPQVVVLNQTAARQIFGDTDPVGQVLTRGTLDQTGDSLHPLLFMPPLRAEVVGVAEDVRYRGLGIEDDATVYHPLAQLPYRTLYYVVGPSIPGFPSRSSRCSMSSMGPWCANASP
jgi:putative ABC transport system permease protein